MKNIAGVGHIQFIEEPWAVWVRECGDPNRSCTNWALSPVPSLHLPLPLLSKIAGVGLRKPIEDKAAYWEKSTNICTYFALTI